ncbi:hypothetical protein V5799_014290, partial [Amblyomma americanum]
EQFEHSFSLKHHTKLDEHTASKWYHICELCKLKVGPLNNFAAHVSGRKHRRAVELYKESIVAKEVKASGTVGKKNNPKQKGAKVVPKGSKKQLISKGKQSKQGQEYKQHTSPREPVKNSAAVKKKSTIGQHVEECQRILRSRSRGYQEEKSTDPEGGAGAGSLEPGDEAQLGENVQPSEGQQAKPRKKSSLEPAAKRSKVDNYDECGGAIGEDDCGEGDDEEMSRNWNGGGYHQRFPMGGPPPYGGRGGHMGFRGGHGNMYAWDRPPFGPFNNPRPFNRYGRRPPDEGPSPWESDGYGYNGNWEGNRQYNSNFYEDVADVVWHNANDGKNLPYHPSENAAQSGAATTAGPSKESNEKAAATWGGQSGSSSKPSGTSLNGSRPTTPAKSSLKSSAPMASGVSEQSGSGKTTLPAKSSLKSATPAKELPTARKGEASAKGTGTTATKGAVRKPLLATPTATKAPATTGKATTRTTGPGPPAKSKVADGPKTSGAPSLKVAAPPKTSGEWPKSSGPTKAPVAAKASVSTCTKAIDSTKPAARSSASPSLAIVKAKAQVKKELADGAESAEEEAASAAAQASSSRSHLIFLSSEDDEKDETGNKPQPKRKSRLEGNAPVEAAKKGRAGATAAAPLPCSPEREVQSKKGPLLKSPKLGLMTTKDVYRRDVLEKLINFPSSPQVQTQLNKWMLEMRKYQRSISARNTLRLCSTQARLEQEDDMLGSVPSIDFDVLLRQVESCELPEEMLKSLMQALNTDTEQQPLLSTTTDAPSSTTAVPATSSASSSKAGSNLSSGLGAKVDAAKKKADTSSAKILEPTKDLGLKRKSPNIAMKAAAATSTAQNDSSSSSSSSDDEECVVLPTPKKPVVSVNLIDSDDEESESSTDEEEEEDTKPSTTTLTSKPSGRQVAPAEKPVASQGSVSTTEKPSTLTSGRRKTVKEGPACLKDPENTHPRRKSMQRTQAIGIFDDARRRPDRSAASETFTAEKQALGERV